MDTERQLVMAKHGHLGGYIYGGDPYTYHPVVWTYLIQRLGVKSMLDVGCGEGQAIDFFREQEVHALGIDGVPQGSPYIATHDYTTGPYPGPIVGDFDLVWSCEFVEHVEEQYAPNFIDTFRHGKFLAMTHALPGQGGWHHVNCQTDDYWIGKLAEVGFVEDVAMTETARRLAVYDRAGSYFSISGLVFRRETVGGDLRPVDTTADRDVADAETTRLTPGDDALQGR